MGLGSEFWDIVRELKHEDRTVAGLNALRGKVLAIDLSYWICQMDGIRMGSRSKCGGAAVHAKGSRYHTNLKTHLRNLFYRTVKLVSRVRFRIPHSAFRIPVRTSLDRTSHT